MSHRGSVPDSSGSRHMRIPDANVRAKPPCPRHSGEAGLPLARESPLMKGSSYIASKHAQVDTVLHPCQTIECVGSDRSSPRATSCAPVAQLDRALAYEARGRVFESPRAYHLLMIFDLYSRESCPNLFHFPAAHVFPPRRPAGNHAFQLLAIVLVALALF